MLKDRKMVLMIGVVLVLFFVLFLLYFLIGRNTVLAFDEIEKRMENAAKSYVSKNPEEFDLEIDRETNLSIEQLENGYMREMNKMVDENVSCYGEVKVRVFNGDVGYFPFLNCGDDHKTTFLSERIKQTQEILTAGAGLYASGDSYYFRGEEVNNHVEFSGKMWRILAINSDSSVKLIEVSPERSTQWDNKYNVERNRSDGINDYINLEKENSSINYHINGFLENDEYITPENRVKLNYMNLCVGPRGEADTSKNGSTECKKIAENQLIGLISLYEYLRVSLDDDCKATPDRACINYNYLAKIPDSWWTITPEAGATHRVYRISNGYLSPVNASNRSRPRTVITLNPNVASRAGDGTIESPYLVN